MKQCRIAWKSSATEAEGNGEWFPEEKRKSLDKHLAIAKAQFPEIDHWTEEQGATDAE